MSGYLCETGSEESFSASDGFAGDEESSILLSESEHDAVAEPSAQATQMKEFASAETRRVRLGRMLVLLSILIAGAVVSTLTYLILTKELESDAEDSVSRWTLLSFKGKKETLTSITFLCLLPSVHPFRQYYRGKLQISSEEYL
jgi:hypothetical protein